jgi:hypothetical protein
VGTRALALLLALATPALAQEVAPVASVHDLRAAPAVAVGQRARVASRVDQQATIVTKVGGKPVGEEQEQGRRLELVVVDEVASVGADGEADQVLRTFETLSGEAPAGLAGVRVRVVRKPDGTEALATPEGTPLDDKTAQLVAGAQELERGQGLRNLRWALPEKPVAIGATWPIAREQVDDLLKVTGGEAGEYELREALGTFETVEARDGVDVYIVVVRLQLAISGMEGMTLDPPGDFELVLRHESTGAASSWRRTTVDATFHGVMSFEGQKDTQLSFDARFQTEERVEPLGEGE